ncbi:MAG: transposase domain-containing protein [Betaproteobacteria bacterium]|nr:transposase domain-containing protein [Betaproteobacteria bacterium]
MTLIKSAKLCDIDPWAYLKDVLTKLPTWPNRRLGELLPHNSGRRPSLAQTKRWLDPSTPCQDGIAGRL